MKGNFNNEETRHEKGLLKLISLLSAKAFSIEQGVAVKLWLKGLRLNYQLWILKSPRIQKLMGTIPLPGSRHQCINTNFQKYCHEFFSSATRC